MWEREYNSFAIGATWEKPHVLNWTRIFIQSSTHAISSIPYLLKSLMLGLHAERRPMPSFPHQPRLAETLLSHRGPHCLDATLWCKEVLVAKLDLRLLMCFSWNAWLHCELQEKWAKGKKKQCEADFYSNKKNQKPWLLKYSMVFRFIKHTLFICRLFQQK